MALPKARRRRALPTVVTAQFFSSLGDNALLIAAIGLLMDRDAADWEIPALRIFFYLAYVLLAPFAGAVADALPKERVLFYTNLIKIGGCGLLLAQVHPLLAYTLVGLGAAAYAPAKYGILPEMLPAEALVAANAWIEGSTVVSILLGVGLGSLLLSPSSAVPHLVGGAAANATALIGIVYLLAAACTAAIPRTTARNTAALGNPRRLLREFGRSFLVLWRDRDGQVSLAVTSLFWAAAAALQFIVLRWATAVLHMSLAQAALLQGAVAVGMITSAIAAARWIPLHCALSVLPLGLAVSALVLSMTTVTGVHVALAVLFAIGALAGLFVIPMNALLQHRGHVLMHSGQSIAVQNFNENAASLVALAVYGALVYAGSPLRLTIAGLGLFVSLGMLLIIVRHRARRSPRAADVAT